MSPRTRQLSLPGELASVPAGRHFVRDLLLEWGFPEAVDDAALAVTELMANAVKHARSPLVVTVRVEEQIVVSVRDAHPRLTHPVGPVPALAESGRGLRIVAAVSADWGVVTDADGKSLWFSLPLPDRTSADADVISIRPPAGLVPADRSRVIRMDGTGAQSRMAG